jgi:hypothetical protein
VQTLKNKQPELIENFQLTQVRKAIYDRDYKLQLIGSQAEQLFNIAHDPLETNNLVNQHADLVQDLQQKLLQNPSENIEQITTSKTLSPLVQENLRALGYIE